MVWNDGNIDRSRENRYCVIHIFLKIMKYFLVEQSKVQELVYGLNGPAFRLLVLGSVI